MIKERREEENGDERKETSLRYTQMREEIMNKCSECVIESVAEECRGEEKKMRKKNMADRWTIQILFTCFILSPKHWALAAR